MIDLLPDRIALYLRWLLRMVLSYERYAPSRLATPASATEHQQRTLPIVRCSGRWVTSTADPRSYVRKGWVSIPLLGREPDSDPTVTGSQCCAVNAF